MNISLDRDGAVFSEDGAYRYALWRRLNENEKTLFIIGLNPSTADEKTNDATIRRCIGFAKSWDFGCLVVGNLFAYKTSKPASLKTTQFPVGTFNDMWLKRLHQESDMTLVAWGVHGAYLNRGNEVLSFIKDPYCLDVTKAQYPRHPLYVKADQLPQPYIST
jgi:hypothetical protein